MVPVVLSKYSEVINNALSKILDEYDPDCKSVFDAMKYSVGAGGKRLRPAVLLEFCNVCGGDISKALPAACAIEFIHTYSLIHDDLPCMDNDDMRRGKPSCHIAFGEDTALLAGDSLLTLAFRSISGMDSSIDCDRIIRAVGVLSEAAGAFGMIGGQIMDLENESKDIQTDKIFKMYRLKTSELIRAAAVTGCILGEGNDCDIKAATEYANNIGLAFQIRDDILDIIGDRSVLGKPIGSDNCNGKSTVVAAIGLERSQELVNEYTVKAKNAANYFGDKGKDLRDFADYLATREK